jgi:hypothetical protein
MKYRDGNEVYLGDKVVADDSEGLVVMVLDTRQFSDEYPEGWTNEVRGAFVETKKWGLIHYPEFDEDVTLLQRAEK